MTTFPPPAERCAVRADAREDPMLGTAFPAARLLLVEQHFPWGPDGLRTSRFDAESARALEARGRAETVRVQAIRALGRAPDDHRRRWMLVDTRAAARTVRSGTFTDDAELLDLPFDGTAGELEADPLYLVCTHGRHDPCCAQRGRPVVAALAVARPGRVWQASHLGGCRFASTVLTVPDGVMYGRVQPAAVDALVAATEAREVHVPLLRGRIGVPPAVQSALGFAHAQLGIAGVGDLSPAGSRAAEGDDVVVALDTPRGRFDVTVRRRRVDAAGLTCGHPGPAFFVAHDPVAIEPAG